MISQNAGIAVKENRNEKGSKQDTGKQGAGDTGIFCFLAAVHEKRIKQHRKEDQLHMFPGGLICRKEKSENVVLLRPVINKMRNGADNQDKYGANDRVKF